MELGGGGVIRVVDDCWFEGRRDLPSPKGYGEAGACGTKAGARVGGIGGGFGRRGEFVGGVFEFFECLAEAFAGPADVRGVGGAGVFRTGGQGAFEAAAEDVLDEAVLEPQG